MKRITLFTKGNVDVHDSLHSCLIAGERRWNGVNDLIRSRGVTIKLKHETFTRSDSLIDANGEIPAEVSTRNLELGSFPARSQYSDAIFSSNADAFVLSIQPDVATGLFRHKKGGFAFHPHELARWSASDKEWIRTDFHEVGLLSAERSMANLETIIDRIREKSDAPILIYNVSPNVPGEIVHCYQGLGETYSQRARRFNLGLTDLSATTGISIVDVETILARVGTDRLKVDVNHLQPEGYRLVAEEVVRILEDLGLLETLETHECAPV